MSTPGRTCPFCQSDQITAVAVEGVRGDLIAFRCITCGKGWSEMTAASHLPDGRSVAHERQER